MAPARFLDQSDPEEGFSVLRNDVETGTPGDGEDLPVDGELTGKEHYGPGGTAVYRAHQLYRFVQGLTKGVFPKSRECLRAEPAETIGVIERQSGIGIQVVKAEP